MPEQVAFGSQPPLSVAQLRATQLRPLPTKPGLHAHTRDSPTPEQRAFASQPPLFVRQASATHWVPSPEYPWLHSQPKEAPEPEQVAFAPQPPLLTSQEPVSGPASEALAPRVQKPEVPQVYPAGQ